MPERGDPTTKTGALLREVDFAPMATEVRVVSIKLDSLVEARRRITFG